jgi:enediyne biosynthesis protein E5
MIPDPATTPIKPARQIAFGVSVATIYALLLVVHVVYGLFIALALTSATRGLSLHAHALLKRKRAAMPESIEPVRIPAAAEVAQLKQA